MDVWVYAGRRYREEADRIAEELRESDEHGTVVRANSRYYDGMVHEGCVVYHDGCRRDLQMAHEDAGVELRRVDRQRTVPRDPEPAPKQDPAAPAYRVENTSPGWWKVLDGDGEQVGPSHRSEQDAREALRAIE